MAKRRLTSRQKRQRTKKIRNRVILALAVLALTSAAMAPELRAYLNAKIRRGVQAFADLRAQEIEVTLPERRIYALQLGVFDNGESAESERKRLAAMGVPCVRYDLENWKGILASKCKLFTDIDTAFVPIGRIIRKSTLKGCLDYYKNLGDEFYEQLCSMLVFDALIYNEDRHFGNFGLLRDNHTGAILSPAPIFDNGLSLFNFAMPDDFKNLSEYAKTRSNPYRISYEEVCKEVMGAKQKAQLRRLIGFRFKRHPFLNLPEERLTAIEKQLVERTRELLSIPVQRSAKRKTEPER